MSLYSLDSISPDIHADTWIAPNAVVIGKVVLEKDVSLWWNCVLRGDRDWIHIGQGSNIQDGSILHTNPSMPLTLGKNVTVGHSVILHGCTIADYCLVGMGATMLNNAKVGENSIVAAGALIPEGKIYPERSLIMGSPGKVVRELTDQEIESLPKMAENYIENWKRYRESLIKIV